MLLFKPDYYDCFRCAAGECPDSCCKEWEVEIDDASARFYRTLPGTLGDRLREVMRTADGKKPRVLPVRNSYSELQE